MGGACNLETDNSRTPPPPAIVQVPTPAPARDRSTNKTISLLNDESPLIIEVGNGEDRPVTFTSKLKIRVKSKLNQNLAESNPDTHPIGFFHNIMQQLINK